jgi:polyketide cyclase/dehydrase/lipid transport protein
MALFLLILFGSGAVTALLVWLDSSVLDTYGWTLFVGLPLVLGFVAGLLCCWRRRPCTERLCWGASCLALVGSGFGLLAAGLEGLVCLLMALPLALPMAMLGGSLAFRLSRIRRLSPAMILLLSLLSTPFLMGAETAVRSKPEVLRVSTAVVVDAPPEKVWRKVVSFSELPPPKEWLFQTGVAYPMRAEIRGRGVGALRYCVFSTGAFVEPITVWDEPRRLEFSVIENPAPMKEWSPYASIHPPHLEGFLVSSKGRFELQRLSGNRTRLVGTTWYQHGLAPAGYWRLWSDQILHRIHLRVLNHVKRLSEEAREAI